MRIAIGSDHRGYDLKRRVVSYLEHVGHTVLDTGTHSGSDTVDYPDFAFRVGEAIRDGEADRGVLIDGTGIGMCIAANKVAGIRAALCHDSITVEMSRRHNDANILCLSADLIGDELVDRMLRIWLETNFEGNRHQRRIEKIVGYEKGP
ncbi:MAG: ribose 5-phosphate isomerase B [Gemmataceae bacterium]